MNNTSQHNGFSVHNGTAGEPMPPKVKPVSSAYSEAAASASAKRGHRRKDGEAEQGQTDAKQTPTHRRAPKGTARPVANRTAADRPSVRRSGIAAEVAAAARSGATGHRAARTTSVSAAGAASSPSAEPTARRSSGFAGKVKDAVSAGAERVKGAAASTSAGAAPARRSARGASAGARAGASAVDEERASRRAAYEARRQSSLMKYANDNRVVRALYDFTSGPYRAVFYVLVVAVIALGVYFPVRDLYIAHRTNGILQEQLAIREKYNESLEKEVNKYLSQEGIEEAAREQGMVMPGETPITVQGADQLGDNGQASSQDGSVDGAQSDDAAGADGADDSASGAAGGGEDGSGTGAAGSSSDEPSTSAEVERAEREVYANSPWYYKVLDSLFFYSGPSDQVVKSTGE
ncbi:FtsB family cell division protein [Collinsella tanakaei]|uniref:FtsB family cell division protein n=1 Tax=Collinsella tanakaei TaxID=626935 RepID=UPI00265CAE7D|nr:septum formation initiator family protein [Collinsella tanakaei]